MPSIASTSMSPPTIASSHSSKKSPEKGNKHHISSKDKDRQKKKSKRHSASASKDDQPQMKDGWKGKKVVGPKESAFRYMYPVVDMLIPPALIQDGHRAANELMDTLLMRCVDE